MHPNIKSVVDSLLPQRAKFQFSGSNACGVGTEVTDQITEPVASADETVRMQGDEEFRPAFGQSQVQSRAMGVASAGIAGISSLDQSNPG